jgi:hypothetical protein
LASVPLLQLQVVLVLPEILDRRWRSIIIEVKLDGFASLYLFKIREEREGTEKRLKPMMIVATTPSSLPSPFSVTKILNIKKLQFGFNSSSPLDGFDLRPT